MSRWDWPSSVRSWFEIECSKCWTLSCNLTRRAAFATAIEKHRQCRPAVATVLRRGFVPKKTKWCWTIWLHSGPAELPSVDALAKVESGYDGCDA